MSDIGIERIMVEKVMCVGALGLRTSRTMVVPGN